MLVERVLDLAEAPVRPTAGSEDSAPAKEKSSPRRFRSGTKYPDWTPDEDEALRRAYASGERIDHLAVLLGRSYKGAISRAKKLGFSHPRDIKGGFITSPKWSAAEDALLRQLYGNIPTPELPGRIGRSKSAIFNRAFALGLHHGYQRCWTRPELAALRIAYEREIAIADVAAALGRKACSVSKFASNHRMFFGARPLVVEPLTLQDILALEDPSAPLPLQVDARHGRSRTDHKRLISETAKRAKRQESEAASRQKRAETRAVERAQRDRERAAKRARLKEERAVELKLRAERRRLAQLSAQRERERSRAAAALERVREKEERHHARDRVAMDRANRRRSNAVRRSQIERAAAFVDSGKAISKGTNVHIKIAARAVIEQRAEAARQACPIEQAKVALQRRGKIVHSMAVWGGSSDRYFVSGLGRDVTAEQLLAEASRLAA